MSTQKSEFSQVAQVPANVVDSGKVYLGGGAINLIKPAVTDKGKVKIGGTACSVSPYGVAMVKTTGLEQAVQDAIKYLIDNNFYTKLLNTWGVSDGAIASSAVTLNNNNSIGASCVPSY